MYNICIILIKMDIGMCNLYVQKFGILSNVVFNNVNEKLLIIKNSGGKKIKKFFVGVINLE